MLVSDTYRTVPFYAETERWNAWGMLLLFWGASAHMIDLVAASAVLRTSVPP